MKPKSQFALEHIYTYGFAMLCIMVFLAALYYLFPFNAESDAIFCNSNHELPCVLSESGVVTDQYGNTIIRVGMRNPGSIPLHTLTHDFYKHITILKNECTPQALAFTIDGISHDIITRDTQIHWPSGKIAYFDLYCTPIAGKTVRLSLDIQHKQVIRDFPRQQTVDALLEKYANIITVVFADIDAPQCSDRRDNDGDGKCDHDGAPGALGCNGIPDPGCVSPDDDDETDPPLPQCMDGIDNDGDGAIDFPADFSCQSIFDNDEAFPVAQCQDGIDNDGDLFCDFDGGVSGPTCLGPPDPSCRSPQDNDESIDVLYIDQCQELYLPYTRYILNQSVSSSETCFIISADFVTLDLNGYTVQGDGEVPDAYGVFIRGVTSSHVSNGEIINYWTGVGGNNANSATLSNIFISSIRAVAAEVTSDSVYGITFNGGSRNIISNSVVSTIYPANAPVMNTAGVALNGCNLCGIIYSSIDEVRGNTQNTAALRVISSEGNIFHGLQIEYSPDSHGIIIQNAPGTYLGNAIIGNTKTALRLRNQDDMTIENILIIDSDTGLDLERVNTLTVNAVTLRNNNRHIIMNVSVNATLRNIQALDAQQTAIQIQSIPGPTYASVLLFEKMNVSLTQDGNPDIVASSQTNLTLVDSSFTGGYAFATTTLAVQNTHRARIEYLWLHHTGSNFNQDFELDTNKAVKVTSVWPAAIYLYGLATPLDPNLLRIYRNNDTCDDCVLVGSMTDNPVTFLAFQEGTYRVLG